MCVDRQLSLMAEKLKGRLSVCLSVCLNTCAGVEQPGLKLLLNSIGQVSITRQSVVTKA